VAVTSGRWRCSPALPAHTTEEVRDLLADERDTGSARGRGLLRELGRAFGGPYHVLLPGRFDGNVAAFRYVFAEAGVDGGIYFAKKANKAAAFVERAAVLDIGVDVASRGELAEALGHGVRGADLVVTGPAKHDEVLRLAILHGCLVAVDAVDELERIIARAGELHRNARLLLRRRPPAQPHSRFGLDDAELDKALARCAEAGHAVALEGFGFHLAGYEPRPRTDLAGELVRLCRRARAMGLRPDRISIGGGFPVDYVSALDWRRFTTADRPGHYHADKTFAGRYPYHSPTAGADALRAILTGIPAGERQPLAELLRAARIRLLIEPGRALLDQAGCTVFTVQGVKERDGYAILTVDGTSLSLSEQWFNSEFLPDPVLVPAGGAAPDPSVSDPATYPACVGGATCLESDLLTWRKIPFPARPAVGDLLVYLNTAGYQMDSNESPFHELPLPPKVVLDPDAGGTRWRLDRRA
jgi:diaminopimelate decarboxylase